MHSKFELKTLAQTRNARLRESLTAVDAEVAAQAAAIADAEAAEKLRAADIERKTRDIDGLNRRLQKLTERAVDENTGALRMADGVACWYRQFEVQVKCIALESEPRGRAGARFCTQMQLAHHHQRC